MIQGVGKAIQSSSYSFCNWPSEISDALSHSTHQYSDCTSERKNEFFGECKNAAVQLTVSTEADWPHPSKYEENSVCVYFFKYERI